MVDLAFPALTAKLFDEFCARRGRQVNSVLDAQLINAIDYALVHSKAPVEYLQALLAETHEDTVAAARILSVARYGHRNGVSPAYIAAVFRLPFEAEGHNEHSSVQDRVECLHSAGVPAAYAVALCGSGLSVREVVRYWRDGLSAEYVTAVF